MSSINKKLKEFENLCVDWDYRNIDMTEPHLQGIEIIDNDILVNLDNNQEYVTIDTLKNLNEILNKKIDLLEERLNNLENNDKE